MANMTMRDRIILAGWLRAGLSLAEVEAIPRIGLVGNERFSEAARRAYILIWSWSAPRMAGWAGAEQDRLYSKAGKALYQRRIERANGWAKRLAGVKA